MFGPSEMMIVSGFCFTTRPVACTASTNSAIACLTVIFAGVITVSFVAYLVTPLS
ncbi:hypothetical protein D3C83_289050 [compost metagenome]